MEKIIQVELLKEFIRKYEHEILSLYFDTDYKLRNRSKVFNISNDYLNGKINTCKRLRYKFLELIDEYFSDIEIWFDRNDEE